MKSIKNKIMVFFKHYSWIIYTILFVGVLIMALIEMQSDADYIVSGLDFFEKMLFSKVELDKSNFVLGALGYSYIACIGFALVKYLFPCLISILFAKENDNVVIIGKDMSDVISKKIGNWFFSKVIQVTFVGFFIIIVASYFWWLDCIISFMAFLRKKINLNVGEV